VTATNVTAIEGDREIREAEASLADLEQRRRRLRAACEATTEEVDRARAGRREDLLAGDQKRAAVAEKAIVKGEQDGVRMFEELELVEAAIPDARVKILLARARAKRREADASLAAVGKRREEYEAAVRAAESARRALDRAKLEHDGLVEEAAALGRRAGQVKQREEGRRAALAASEAA